MKTNLLIALCLIISSTSCSSQNKTNLLTIQFGQSISELISAKKLNESQDAFYGLYSYETNKLENFKIGDKQLSTYEYPNSATSNYNSLQIYVNNHVEKQYLGFRYSTIKQDEIQELISYLKNKFPISVIRKDSAGEVYFWNIDTMDAWLFYEPEFFIDATGKKVVQSHFVFIKKGTRLDNSIEPSVPTLWDQIDYLYQ